MLVANDVLPAAALPSAKVRRRTSVGFAWAGFMALLALRCADRLRQPHLWAEDGVVFFSQAFEHGARSLALSYAGHHHLGPRLVAWLLTFLPVKAFAYGCTLSSMAVHAAVCTTLLRPGYGWLVRSPVLRAGACLAMAMGPGLYEVLGNLANLHNLLMMFVGLRLLRAPQARLGRWDWALLLLAAGSDGSVAVWCPALAMRLWLQRSLPIHLRAGARRDDVATGVLLLAASCVHAWTLRATAALPHERFAPVPVDVAARTLTYVAAQRFAVHPWRGATGATVHMPATQTGICLVLAGLVAIAAAVALRRPRQMALVVAGCACVLALYAVTIVVRPYSATYLVERLPHIFRHRYAVAAFPFAVVFWACAIDTLRELWRGAYVVAALALVAFVDRTQPFNLGPQEGACTGWHQTAAQIQEAVDARRCATLRFACNSTNWAFTYQSPKAWCR